MNHDLLILPRYCVFADEKRKLLVSGAGPLIQVYKSDAEEGSYPISTIHVFDRQNVNVEFIQPIENTGHFVVAGNTFLTVLHADEITSEISWVNQERMHECSIDYSISKLFSVIKSKCAEDLSVVVHSHKGGCVVRYSIRVFKEEEKGLLHSTVSPEERLSRINDSFELVQLTPTTFFDCNQHDYCDRAGNYGKAATDFMATSYDGRFVVTTDASGEIAVNSVEKMGRKEKGVTIYSKSFTVGTLKFQQAKPTAIAATRIANSLGLKKWRNDNCHGVIIVVGYEDGTFYFTSKDGNATSKRVGVFHNKKYGAILSIAMLKNRVFFTTKSGCLGVMDIPTASGAMNTSIRTRTVMLGSVKISESINDEMIISHCAVHLMTSPVTSLCIVGDSFNILSIPKSGESPILLLSLNTRHFNRIAVTVHPPDLYRCSKPRLWIFMANDDTLRQQDDCCVRNGPKPPARLSMMRLSSSDVLETTMMESNRDYIVKEIEYEGVDKVRSLAVPPTWMWWAANTEGEDIRLVIFTPHDRIVIMQPDLSDERAGKCLSPICGCMIPLSAATLPFSTTGSHHGIFYSKDLDSIVYWISTDGSLKTVRMLNRKDEDGENDQSADWKSLELPSPGLCCALFYEREKEPRIAIGTASGDVFVYCITDSKIVLNQSIIQAPITAISVYHCMHTGSRTFFNIILTASSRSVVLSSYGDGELSILAQAKCAVDHPKAVYCIEEKKRKSLRVVVVGHHAQTLYFCLDPLFKLHGEPTKEGRRNTFLISANPILSEYAMSGQPSPV